jgi:hypothetical protein
MHTFCSFGMADSRAILDAIRGTSREQDAQLQLRTTLEKSERRLCSTPADWDGMFAVLDHSHALGVVHLLCVVVHQVPPSLACSFVPL